MQSDDKRPKIYFAVSITGGRELAETYDKIGSILNSKGIVLTEHMTKNSITSNGENLSASFIHDRDLKWIDESDVVVAEVTNTSLGVGYELGYVFGRHTGRSNKPVLALYNTGAARNKLSGMIRGSPSVESHEYSTIEEAKVIIDEFFKRKLK